VKQRTLVRTEKQSHAEQNKLCWQTNALQVLHSLMVNPFADITMTIDGGDETRHFFQTVVPMAVQ
jgi:hypothetical protein